MEGNGCESPWRDPHTRGPCRSNLVHSTTASIHEGLASLTVYLHEVGDLLALTNILVQLHIIKTEAPKRHLTNLGGTTLQKVIDVVDDDELLALVLQMIISPTLNSPH